MAIITFKLSDWTAPLVEDYSGIPGASLPTMSALSLHYRAPLNWRLIRYPESTRLDFGNQGMPRNIWGFFANPPSYIWYLIALSVFWPSIQWLILWRYVNMAAVMVLIPKMTLVWRKGPMPIREGCATFTQEKFKGRKFPSVWMAVVVGNPDVTTTSPDCHSANHPYGCVISGKTMRFPFADLAVVTFPCGPGGCYHPEGNPFKNIIMGPVCTGAILLAGTATAAGPDPACHLRGLDLGNWNDIPSLPPALR